MQTRAGIRYMRRFASTTKSIISKQISNSSSIMILGIYHSGVPCAWYTGRADGDDSNNEPMWSFEFAPSWARSDAACGSHALAESEPIMNTTLAILRPQRPTLACAGCVAESRSNNESIARSLDGLPSLIPLFAFATDVFPTL
jgi:hypothetical protein